MKKSLKKVRTRRVTFIRPHVLLLTDTLRITRDGIVTETKQPYYLYLKGKRPE